MLTESVLLAIWDAQFYLNAKINQYSKTNVFFTLWKKWVKWRTCCNFEKCNVLFIWWIIFTELTLLPGFPSGKQWLIVFMRKREGERKEGGRQTDRQGCILRPIRETVPKWISSVLPFNFVQAVIQKTFTYLSSDYDVPLKFYKWNRSICKCKLVIIHTHSESDPLGV